MNVETVYNWARVQPFKPALIYNDNAISYATFARVIEKWRRFFQRQNPIPGTTAAVLLSHLVDCWVAVLALQSLGMTTVHVRSVAEAKELNLKNLSWIVTTFAEEPFNDFRQNVPADVTAVLIPENQPHIEANELAAPEASRSYGAHILYTTGTTGDFKKVLWSGALEERRSNARCRIYRFDTTSVVHNLSFGLWTGTGYKTALSVWLAGGCLVLDQRAERFRMFFRNKITFAKMTPAMFRGLLAATTEWTSCQIWLGGAATAGSVIDQAITRFGADIYLNYTSTELATYALVSHIRKPDDVVWLQPPPGRIVHIVDEFGRECSSHQEGELRIRTTDLDCQSYLDDAETSSKVFRNGFFYPGDRAVKRADGRIRILGRTSDVLNIQGEKVAVAPIEQQIQQLLGVDDVCVFAGVNNTGQDQLVIALQANYMPAANELHAVQRSFPAFERVRFVVLKEFPRTQTGTREKVLRQALRNLVFEDDPKRAGADKPLH